MACTWLAYEFSYKPGDVRAAVRPGSPRTSRGSTGRCGLPRWKDTKTAGVVSKLLRATARGRRDVLALLAKNPFPAIRRDTCAASLYRYRMTDAADPPAQPASWWTREPLGEYSPPISLKPGQ